ncbi:tRNA 2-selenouridine(34) synthase MnmH [Pseudogemmobacter sp. W21_MBD1_M6]|uniref:tRNA 2-selenouridine(34) synthase MnmH n=1 Tax=Pseudogemmobacter sp. W21_MBD1_M6 TaxID=3240271 RepID=UPI003F9CB507
MAITLSSLSDLANVTHDTLIDVRSPAEFAEDHLPGAINLPALNDAERAEIGTIYVQESPFKARRIGGALVARNVAHHLQTALADKDGSWRPLVYCWRGGQRSGSFASILTQIGWRADLIAGGYQTYRRLVVQAVYDTPFRAPVTLLDGNTGTAKTDLLARLAARGVQVIDLEGLANHRGSLFGARASGQPSQKAFEGAVAAIIGQIDQSRPVVIEAESSKVGERIVPPALWTAMKGAPRLEIVAPLAARARYLVTAYADIIDDPARLTGVLGRLKGHQSARQIEDWQAMAAAQDMEALAASLMEIHYDPRYAKGRAGAENSRQVSVDDLAGTTLDALADRLAPQFL